MSKIIAVIHARMKSGRLPGKVMKDLSGKSVFYHHWERMRQCKGIDAIYLGTSKDKANAPLIQEAVKYGIPYYAGAEEDVSERYITIAERENADAVVRCGCDMPLFSYEIVNQLIRAYDGECLLDVATSLPTGIGSEILSVKALKTIREKYRGPAISKYIFEYPHLFNTRKIEVDDEFSRPEFRLTLDTSEDYTVIKTIYDIFYRDGTSIDIKEVFKYLDDHPNIANINRHVQDKQLNAYVWQELAQKPVFSLYKMPSGKYVVTNRMGELLSPDEFKNVFATIKWDEE